MPRITFAPAFARWLTASPGSNAAPVTVTVSGTTARECLNDAFRQFPMLRSYALDEHGALRHHVMLYLDSAPVTDKENLGTPVNADSELYLFQALSGG